MRKTTWGYFAFGAVVGAALGVLFAPRAGKETREQLGDWFKRKREETARTVRELRHKGELQKEKVSAAWKAGQEAWKEKGQEQHKEKELVG